jgi:tetratricopeptide (TPR) repeat protein
MGKLQGPWVQCGNDGARRITEGKSKYKRIAGILEKDLEKDPKNRRSTFYLAQSYRDAGEYEKAIHFYEKRASMGGWPEEIWNALYQIARIKEFFLNRSFEECEKAYQTAYRFMPSRAEASCALAALYRKNKDIPMARAWASVAVMTRFPESDKLFIEESVYSWKSLDELCVASSKLGMLEDAKEASIKLIANQDIQGKDRLRIESNLTFSFSPITKRPISIKAEPKILVVLSTYNPDPKALRNAVDSIIAQTYKNWELLIVSDGNDSPPWDALEEISDPRIKKYHLKKNCGQFQIYDFILQNTKYHLFAVQDDDDISKPNRLEVLLENMSRTGADVVFSDLEIERVDGKVLYFPSHPEWLGRYPDRIVHVGSHVGLWRTDSLRAIGGYYGGFRLGADTVVVGLMARLGRPSFVRQSLYRVKENRESMTRAESTGVNSPARKKAWDDIYAMWDRVKVAKDPLQEASKILREGSKDSDFETLKALIEEPK